VSSTAFAVFALQASAQSAKEPLDANGVPCNGVLDGAHQCMPTAVTKSTIEHPYRRAGQSDGRLDLPNGQGFHAGYSGLYNNSSKVRELVYVALPGGFGNYVGSDQRAGEGIVVLDVKNGYTFERRIHLQHLGAPIVPQQVTSMMASPATNMLYVSTRERLYAMDLATEKVVWSNSYEPGTCCERGQVTPDGLTLEVGSDLKNFHRVIDARTGKVKGIIKTPLSNYNHNMGMSADGKTVFDAPNGLTMTVADMATMKAIKAITFSDHIRVFVINHDASRVYANLNNLLGFEIADVATGKVIKRIEAPAAMWKAKWADRNQHFFGHGGPGHGIGMTPDESEIWVVDDINSGVLVYDNTGEWPVLDTKKSFKTKWAGGWITMGLDGKRAYLSSGDVVDVKTHTIVGQLKDEYGNLLTSEKILDLEFDPSGHLLRTVNQFSEGLPEAFNARMAAQKSKKDNR
jgi:DNA-binding beta-propeller fold protein YncE